MSQQVENLGANGVSIPIADAQARADIVSINNSLTQLGTVDTATSSSVISVNGTYQIPANVLAHTIIIVSCRRQGRGNSSAFLKSDLLQYDVQFMCASTSNGFYTLSCSNTGLLTVTGITGLSEPFITVTGIL